MARLSKFDVEVLLAGYDDDPVAALTHALAKVLDRAGATWVELIAAAPFPAERRQRLLAGTTDALDELLRELNELRAL